MKNRTTPRRTLFFAGGFFALVSTVSAQTADVSFSGGATIRGGGAVRGVVENPDAGASDALTIKPTLGGTIVVDASQVKQTSVLREEQIVWRNSAPFQKDDVASHLKIAKWANEKGLSAQANAHFERVVELDPENEEARRALQHVKVDGVWVSRQERMEQNGWVRVGGRNVSRQEAEIAARRERSEQEARYWRKEIVFLYQGALNGNQRARDALRRIRSPFAIEPILKALSAEGDPEGRVLLAQALGAIGTPDALNELAKVALNDPDLDVRAAAVEGIYNKKPALSNAVEFFRRTLRTSDDVATINRAAFALGRFESERAIPDLINALITSHKRQIVVGGSEQTGATFSNGQLTGFSPGGGAKMKTVTQTFQNETVREALTRVVAANYQTPVDFGFDVASWIAWRREVEQISSFYPRRDH